MKKIRNAAKRISTFIDGGGEYLEDFLLGLRHEINIILRESKDEQ